MKEKKILVTGGAGYIGSHIVLALEHGGYTPVILDDFSSGRAELVQGRQIVTGDIGDRACVAAVLKDNDIENVLHLAASTSVPESVSNPDIYWQNNVEKTGILLECCQAAGVRNIIFSSSAAVYGLSDAVEVDEQAPVNPINPYGETKLAAERKIRESGINHVILRYFNVAGCDPRGRTGQMNKTRSLVRAAVETSLGMQEHFDIFGTDYKTKDGSAVRDFIHVSDLADIHVAALDYFNRGGASAIMNCGYGKGYSVREIIAEVEAIAGKKIKVVEREPRIGDCPALIAKTDKIRETLNWSPRYDDLREMVFTTYAWFQKLYGDSASERAAISR